MALDIRYLAPKFDENGVRNGRKVVCFKHAVMLVMNDIKNDIEEEVDDFRSDFYGPRATCEICHPSN